MANINRFNKLLEQITPERCYDPKNKQYNQTLLIAQMLNRLQSLFIWDNLPETIPQRSLELYLQTNGNVCITEVDNKLYAFTGGMGGKPDVYYMPTIYTVQNPGLLYSAQLQIGEDCVVVPNDSMYLGLLPICERYQSQITECELTLYTNLINGRIFNLISQPDDNTKKSAELYLERVKAGDLAVIAENSFLDGIKTQPYQNGQSNITSLIEYIQYAKQSWFHDLGLNANFNMKRESLNTAETELNDDQLFPMIENMLEMRKKGCENVNNKYGTQIRVRLGSSWDVNFKEFNQTVNNETERTEQNEIKDMVGSDEII